METKVISQDKEIVNEEKYFSVQWWMKDLNLTGNELMIYALINGFSRNGKSRFSGSASYLASWINISRQSVYKILSKLVSKNLIKKTVVFRKNQKYCEYEVVEKEELKEKIVEEAEEVSKNITRQESLHDSQESLHDSQETLQGSQESLQGLSENLTPPIKKVDTPCQESCHNIIDNNIDYNIENNINKINIHTQGEKLQENLSQEKKSNSVLIQQILKKYKSLNLPDFEFPPDSYKIMNAYSRIGVVNLFKALEIMSKSSFVNASMSIDSIFKLDNLKKALNGTFKEIIIEKPRKKKPEREKIIYAKDETEDLVRELGL